MPRVLLELVVAGALAGAGALKLARPAVTAAALPRGGLLAARALGALELALAAAVVAGLRAGAWAAAGLLLAFAIHLLAALVTGRAGAPCACFGAGSRITPLAATRTLALAAVAAAAALLPAASLTTDAWLGLGLALALLGIAGLALAVAALAREVGRLRLELRPQGALEVPEEGPELGAPAPELRLRFGADPGAALLLAVFTSESCALCQALAPAVAALARDPHVALTAFDEQEDAELWRALRIPGSPYAAALARDGVVLAKGTWNTAAQLEGLLATAERRAPEAALAL